MRQPARPLPAEVGIVRAGRSVDVVLLGDLDWPFLQRNGDALAEVQTACASADLVTIDLSDVRFVDSAGLAWMVGLGRHDTGSRAVQLRGVRPAVARILEITGLERLFRDVRGPEVCGTDPQIR